MIGVRARSIASALMLFAALAQMQVAIASTVETLVFVRHGEKPDDVDNGQLTCQGQNRALGLPGVLIGKYGQPNYVFAAEPVENQDSAGVNYWYMRALATIEPTAVAAGVTVNVKYDKSDISDVESELAKRPWFAGDEMTAADIMMSFPLEAAMSRAGLDASRPATVAWVEKVHARPAYQTALAKGGPYAYA